MIFSFNFDSQVSFTNNSHQRHLYAKSWKDNLSLPFYPIFNSKSGWKGFSLILLCGHKSTPFNAYWQVKNFIPSILIDKSIFFSKCGDAEFIPRHVM